MRILSILSLLLLLPSGISSKDIANCKNYPQEFEKSIISIELTSSRSFEKVIGKGYSVKEDKTEKLPYIHFYNREKTEILTLFSHYGDVKNSFSEIRVERNTINAKNIKVLSNKSFVTEKGIHLGMSKINLIKILGSNHTVMKKEESEIITYKLKWKNEKDRAFLKCYNLPEYYGIYIFNKGILTEFQFGFSYA